MHRPGSRPLLPQTNQMQTFSFAPPNLGLGDTKKNYVFVDEHNRHKRLKVMRACEGCRRRKIKCDAATTNSWPCAACVRLKLQCVPPQVNYSRSHSAGGQVSGLERVLDFDNSSGGSGDEDYAQRPLIQNLYQIGSGAELMAASQAGYAGGMAGYHSLQHSPYSDKAEMHHHLPYDAVAAVPMAASDASYRGGPAYPVPAAHPVHVVDGGDAWAREDASALALSEVLGELKIDETGIAPYIYQQKKTLAEAPALEEFEVALPPAPAGSGATVRIPPELMPDDEQAMAYFDIFFTSIHPYVPVIGKAYFYQQWHTSRRSISPLLLEAIFACAGRMSDDPAQGAQWLALASKHEDCFMDVPRLSTIQALLILLKAREAAPKRGYYYRSWMTVKTLVAMAKDLELDEHHADHRSGAGCGSDPTECLVKTRIWQTIFACEIMVGGPQGRFDLGVPVDTVDVGLHPPPPGGDEAEHQISRNFTYLVRTVRNTRIVHEAYVRSRKDKRWGASPAFAALNPVFAKWLEELPADLQIHYPPDGSSPWLPSPFVGNLHIHHHLSLIILHRPQLMHPSSFVAGGSWKEHMAICYSSAKSLCRVQEAILETYGVNGLLCMQRGINFTIYAILTCTMLHLAAITSPDPDLNTDAKDYFTRHMRILESCVSEWPMPDLQAQITSLRQAFSANINKPFELKPSFPFGSPIARLAHSPPVDVQYADHLRHEPRPLHYGNRPITPPVSSTDHDESKDGSLAAASLAMMASGQRQPAPLPSNHPGDEGIAWNPTRIFDRWNAAFGTPPPSSMSGTATSMNQPSPTIYSASSTVASHDLPHLHDAMSQHQHYALPSNMPPVSQMPPPGQTSFTPPNPQASFVSPTMWQDTVAGSFSSHGLKRRWPDDPSLGQSYFSDQQQHLRALVYGD